jgi:transposase
VSAASNVRFRHDSSDLDALRELLRQMLRDGQLDQALDLVLDLLGQVRDTNDVLKVRLHNALRQLYGRRSEKLSVDQLALFEQAFQQTAHDPDPEPASASEPPAPEAQQGSASAPPAGAKSRKPGAHGRSGPPQGLPVERTFKPVAEADRICARCGARMKGFDTEPSWQVEFVPARFVVQFTDCEKVSCEHCRDEVVTAQAPRKVIAASPAGPGLLARILVDKAEDHLPLDRQHKRMAREGFAPAHTTLEGWWAQAADLLMPLHAPLLKEAMGAFVVQMDATGLDVRDKQHPKGIAAEHLWAVVGQRAVVFSFADQKSQGLADLLKKRRAPADAPGAPVQGDGDGAFGTALRKSGLDLVVLGCNMHARRYFERAANNGDLRAKLALQLYTKIYAIERQATADKVTVEERTRRRQEQSLPLLEQLRTWALTIRPSINPSSPLGKALGYVERRWLSLTAFVLDGRIALDTGEVERNIRWIAKGRDNWNYVGSPQAARRLAIVASLCATCRRLGIDPWAYLRDVFAAIAQGLSTPEMIRDWTPWAWAQKQAKNSDAQ